MRIVIAGAGGFGRGVYAWLRASPAHRVKDGISEIVFIDDATPRVEPPAPIVSTIGAYVPDCDDQLICAIGIPETRRGIVHGLADKGCQFHTFVDDHVILAEGVKIGSGVVICPGVVVAANAVLGDHVHINFNCSIGHDTVVGSYSTLSPSVNIMGEVRVGESVFLGGSAVVLPRIELGANLTVGAGAVVVRSVKDSLTIVGNPATPLAPGGAPA